MAATIRHSHLKLFVVFILTIAIHTLRAQSPVASFTTDKNIGCAPLLVNFSNTSTGAVSYAWNFGNSNNSTIANPTTIFLTSGIFQVTLVATSANGQKDTVKQIITVVSDPVAAFIASPLSSCTNANTISFTNNSVNANTYAWDFGDGNSSTLSNPIHSYLNPGTYNIKLIASMRWGLLYR